METSKEPAAPERKHPGLRRESIFAAVALAFGLIVMPLLIYAAGSATLGAYQSGGLGSFLKDFYLGLLHGTGSMWTVVVGPYLFITLFRAVLLLSRRLARAG